MEHAVLAPAAGVVAELRVTTGTQVDAGDVLAVIDGGELMDFAETAEQRLLRSSVAEVAARYGHPYWLGKARAGEKTRELWDEVGRLGYLGVSVPEEYGGGGRGIARAGDRRRGAGRGRLPAAAHRGLPGDLRHDHRPVRHDRAEGALAARAGRAAS